MSEEPCKIASCAMPLQRHEARYQIRVSKFAALGFALALVPLQAFAQSEGQVYDDSTILKPSIPEGFGTDRNVSVLEQPRPDYDPLGIHVSSFILLPKVDFGAGATNNVFLTPDNAKQSDGFLAVDPAFQMNSDWSRHQIQIAGTADLERYFSQPLRNENAFTLKSTGRLDIGSNFNVAVEADGGKHYESPYSGATSSTAAVLSHYTSTYFSGRATYTEGQVRAIAAIDRTSFTFSQINAGDSVFTSQAYRDRDVVRESLQFEYAFTPNISTYAQAAHDDTNYDNLLPSGDPNRSSKGFRVVAGLNFDFAGVLRGNVSAGYIYRDFDSPAYKSVSGVSGEASIEFFPSDLTTFTLKVRRFLEDSAIGSNVPYFNNALSLRVDHELLRNLLLNASAEYGHVQYIGISGEQANYRLILGGKYMASRSFGLNTSISYGTQTVSGLNGHGFTELRGQVGVFFQL